MKTKLTTLLAVLLLSHLASAEALKVSKYAKVYTGEAQFKVIVTNILPKSKKMALVQVSGIDHELDGLVLLHNIQKPARNITTWVTQIKGKDQATLTIDKSGWGRYYSKTTVQLQEEDPIAVIEDSKASKGVKTAALLRAHLRQKRKIAALSKFDRKADLSRQGQAMTSAVKELKDECGFRVNANILWAGFSDKSVKKGRVGKLCSNAVHGMRKACRDDSMKRKLGSIERVTCAKGSTMKAKLKGNHLHFVTDLKSPNQSDYVKYYLLNTL